MKTICCFLLFCIAATSMAYEVVTDDEEEYLLIPVDAPASLRLERQNKFNFDTQSKRAQLSHTGTLFSNDNHHLSHTGSISKGIPKGPLSTGGNLGCTHTPSGSSFSEGAQHTNGFGTDVGVAGRYNFVNKPNTQIYAQGQYDRHYGGAFGTGKPNYGVGVGLEHNF